ncbi:MAG TPA: hypothetical protein VF698_20750 [Thermoanaerobaculia bacterium]|jgi:hypothetical protein
MSDGAFDPFLILSALHEHQVEFVVVGGFAGRIWGSPTVTNDLDICYARDKANRVRLAAVLKKLNARLRGAPPDLPFVLDERTIELGDAFPFTTSAGSLGCLGTPPGTLGFPDLAANAESFDLGDGMIVRFASLDDLIRMKKAAARPKDLIEVEILSAVRRARGTDA